MSTKAKKSNVKPADVEPDSNSQIGFLAKMEEELEEELKRDKARRGLELMPSYSAYPSTGHATSEVSFSDMYFKTESEDSEGHDIPELTGGISGFQPYTEVSIPRPPRPKISAADIMDTEEKLRSRARSTSKLAKPSRSRIAEYMEETNSKRDRLRERNYELLDRFYVTGSEKYLIRFLFKSNILAQNSNCFNSKPPVLNSTDMSKYLHDKVKKSVSSIMDSVNMFLCNVESDEEKRDSLYIDTEAPLSNILTRFYSARNHDFAFFKFRHKDIYLELLREFKLRNISIDEDFLNLRNLDFHELRLHGDYVEAFYSPVIEELILISDDAHSFEYSPHIDMYEHLAQMLPPLETKSAAGKAETIEINGRSYSKIAFENMIETDSESFLTNLEIESYINDREIAEGVVGNGHPISPEDVKLL